VKPTDGGPAPDLPCDPKGHAPATPGWAVVKPGIFKMGSPPGEFCHQKNETRHPVTIAHVFEVKPKEVTQAEYKALMGYNPTSFGELSYCGVSCPAGSITWYTAAVYCNSLTKKVEDQCYECPGSNYSKWCDTHWKYSGTGGQQVDLPLPGLPPPHRGGVGVRLPGRDRHSLLQR